MKGTQWIECSPMVQETWVQSQVCVIPKTLQMVLDTSMLNTQQYKVRIKGKVKQSRKRSSTLLKKEPFGHPRLWSPTLLTFTAKKLLGISKESWKNYFSN